MNSLLPVFIITLHKTRAYAKGCLNDMAKHYHQADQVFWASAPGTGRLRNSNHADGKQSFWFAFEMLRKTGFWFETMQTLSTPLQTITTPIAS